MNSMIFLGSLHTDDDGDESFQRYVDVVSNAISKTRTNTMGNANGI